MTIKDPDHDRPKPTRLDTELAEILERADRPPSNVIKFRAKARTSRSRVQDLKARIREPGPGALLLAALILAFLGSLVSDSSRLAGTALGLAATACFAAVLVIGFRRPGGSATKRWRGQDIQFGDSRPNWMKRPPRPPKR